MPICLARKFKAKIFFFCVERSVFFVGAPGQETGPKKLEQSFKLRFGSFQWKVFFHFLSQPIFPGRLLSQGLEELIAASRISAAASGCSWRDMELCNTRNCSLT